MGYLKVLDGENNMLDALANNETLGATVYTFHDKATYGSALQHTFGEWSHTPVNSGGTTGTTEFRDSAGDIKTFMKGWVRAANAPPQRTALRGKVPAVTELGYLQITDVDTSLDKVIVKGDADTISGVGQRYWLVAPAGVNPETGAIETDPCKMGSLWLWAGYHYRAPIVGFSNPPGQSAGTYGAQTGLNKAGTYECWNRVYEAGTGRWTTPDPASNPWSNVFDYVRGAPISASDPTGEWLPLLIGGGIILGGGALLIGGCGSSATANTTPDSPATISSKCGTFTFKNTHKKAGKAGGSPANYEFEVAFSSTQKCCNCENIVIFQMARTYNASDDQVEKLNRKYDHYDHEGWHIDTLESVKDDKGVTHKHGRWWSPYLMSVGNCKTGTEARAGDYPGVNFEGDQWFVTCAMCAGTGEFYGCIKFQIGYRKVGGQLEPYLKTAPTLRTDSCDWLTNDSTYKKWNEMEPKDNQIPKCVECCQDR